MRAEKQIALTGPRKACRPTPRDHMRSFLREGLPSYRLQDRKVRMERNHLELVPLTIDTSR